MAENMFESSVNGIIAELNSDLEDTAPRGVLATGHMLSLV